MEIIYEVFTVLPYPAMHKGKGCHVLQVFKITVIYLHLEWIRSVPAGHSEVECIYKIVNFSSIYRTIMSKIAPNIRESYLDVKAKIVPWQTMGDFVWDVS